MENGDLYGEWRYVYEEWRCVYGEWRCVGLYGEYRDVYKARSNQEYFITKSPVP